MVGPVVGEEENDGNEEFSEQQKEVTVAQIVKRKKSLSLIKT